MNRPLVDKFTPTGTGLSHASDRGRGTIRSSHRGKMYLYVLTCRAVRPRGGLVASARASLACSVTGFVIRATPRFIGSIVLHLPPPPPPPID